MAVISNFVTHSLHGDFWSVFWGWASRFGQAEVMLPCVLVLTLWLVWSRAGRQAGIWVGSLGVAAGLTGATKLAFIGWGIGSDSLDFTGISGHAMLAAATWPVLLSLFVLRFRPPWQSSAMAAGFGLAVLVAFTRVLLGAHSPSEAVAGFLLGTLVSVVALRRFSLSDTQTPAWLSLALLVWLAVVPVHAPPSKVQDLIVRLALELSEHSKPFTRAHLHKQVL